MVLPCSLSMCFFCPFNILITLLGKRVLVFVRIVHLFVVYARVDLCHFSSSSWCRRLVAASACGSSLTFLFTFLEYSGSVWDPLGVGLQNELDKVQNRAARFVTGNYNFETGSMTGILEH